MSPFRISLGSTLAASLLAIGSLPAAASELAGTFKNQTSGSIVLRYQNDPEYQANLFLSCPTTTNPIYRLPIRQTKKAIELAPGDMVEVRLISGTGIQNGAQTATFNYVTWDAQDRRAEGQVYFHFKEYNQQPHAAPGAGFCWIGTYTKPDPDTGWPGPLFHQENEEAPRFSEEAQFLDRSACVIARDRDHRAPEEAGRK